MKRYLIAAIAGLTLLLVPNAVEAQDVADQDSPDLTPTVAVDEYLLLLYDQTAKKSDDNGYEPRRVVHPLPRSADQQTSPVAPWPSVLDAMQLNFEDTAHLSLTTGKSIVCLDNQVVVRDLATGLDTVLAEGKEYRELGFATVMTRAVISPDGKRIAATVFQGSDKRPVPNPVFDIHIFKVSEGGPEIEAVVFGYTGDSVLGGGLMPLAGPPPIFWADNESLLIAKPKSNWLEEKSSLYLEQDNEPTPEELESFGNSVVIFKGKVLTPTYDLVKINVDQGVSTQVCELKTFPLNSPQNGADFWRRSDGAIMLRSSRTDIRIDLENRQAIPDRRLSRQYELRGENHRPSLWFGDQQLASVIYFRDVNVAPDGKSVAWFARTNEANMANIGNTSQFTTTLWYHSEATGTVKLAEGFFESSLGYSQYDNPVANPRFRWLTEKSLNSQR